MKKFATSRNIALLTRIAVLGALVLLGVGFSPALAAALARGVDAGATLSAMRSMIPPLGAIREWLPPFGWLRARLAGSHHFPVMIGGRTAT